MLRRWIQRSETGVLLFLLAVLSTAAAPPVSGDFRQGISSASEVASPRAANGQPTVVMYYGGYYGGHPGLRYYGPTVSAAVSTLTAPAVTVAGAVNRR